MGKMLINYPMWGRIFEFFDKATVLSAGPRNRNPIFESGLLQMVMTQL